MIKEMIVENFAFKGLEIRSLIIDGDPWFLTADIGKCINFAGTTRAGVSKILKAVSPEDKMLVRQDEYRARFPELWSGPRDRRDKTVVNEIGLYRMLFLCRAKGAQEFQEWAAKVVRSVRKNGGYVEGQELLPSAEKEILEAKIRSLADEAGALIEENARLAEKNTVLACKNAKLQARRHELISGLKKAEAARKRQKKELKAVGEYADLFEVMFEDASRELEVATNEVSRLRELIKKMKSSGTKIPKPVVQTITVDKEGFLVSLT